MKVITLVQAAAAFLTAACSASTGADTHRVADVRVGPYADVSGPTISSVVHDAAIIGRVTLLDRTPLLQLPGQKNGGRHSRDSICAYAYKARAVDLLKGDVREFVFYSSEGKDFYGFDRDYLVIVFKGDEPRFKEEYGGVKDLGCYPPGAYYVGSSIQTMLSFDPDAATKMGGAWIVEPNRESPGWCGYIPKARMILAQDSYMVANWEQYRKSLIENIGNGPYSLC